MATRTLQRNVRNKRTYGLKPNCIHCGLEIMPSKDICPHCGMGQAETKECRNCHLPIRPKVRFCRHCGARQGRWAMAYSILPWAGLAAAVFAASPTLVPFLWRTFVVGHHVDYRVTGFSIEDEPGQVSLSLLNFGSLIGQIPTKMICEGDTDQFGEYRLFFNANSQAVIWGTDPVSVQFELSLGGSDVVIIASQDAEPDAAPSTDQLAWEPEAIYAYLHQFLVDEDGVLLTDKDFESDAVDVSFAEAEADAPEALEGEPPRPNLRFVCTLDPTIVNAVWDWNSNAREAMFDVVIDQTGSITVTDAGLAAEGVAITGEVDKAE